MAQADAKGRDAGIQHFADILDDRHVLGRVAGAVGKHQPVGLQRRQVGRGGGAGQHRHAAAALLQAAHDVVLAAQVQQRHVQRGVPPAAGGRRFPGAGFFTGHGFHRAGDGVGGDLRQQRRGLFRLGFRVKFGGDGAVHDAALPQGAGQAAGIHPFDADDAVLFEEGVQGHLTAEIGGRFARLPHDVAPRPDPAALHILTVHAVVADERIGLGDDLPVVAGVGQRFLKTDHAGGKHHFPDGRARAADAPPAEDPAVCQYQICLHIQSSLLLIKESVWRLPSFCGCPGGPGAACPPCTGGTPPARSWAGPA